jgi:hypothetical protein
MAAAELMLLSMNLSLANCDQNSPSRRVADLGQLKSSGNDQADDILSKSTWYFYLLCINRIGSAASARNLFLSPQAYGLSLYRRE